MSISEVPDERVAGDGGAGEDSTGVDGATEAGRAQRGAGLGEGRERGGIARREPT
jgi:hypothetical protein